MKRQEFYQEWRSMKAIYIKTDWQTEDSNKLSSGIDGVDKVLHLVDDIPDRYMCLLDLQTHGNRNIAVFPSLWNEKAIKIYIPREIVEKGLTFDSTVEKTRYYLNKLKALLKKRLEYLEEEISETESIFLARIQDLQNLRETD